MKELYLDIKNFYKKNKKILDPIIFFTIGFTVAKNKYKKQITYCYKINKKED